MLNYKYMYLHTNTYLAPQSWSMMRLSRQRDEIYVLPLHGNVADNALALGKRAPPSQLLSSNPLGKHCGPHLTKCQGFENSKDKILHEEIFLCHNRGLGR